MNTSALPAPPAGAPPLPPGSGTATAGRLRDYLAGDGPCVPVDCQSLGEGARALIANALAVADRPGLPAAFAEAPDDDLQARVDWFFRLLCLLPQDEREQWMHEQVQRAEAHPLAGSHLRALLDPLLFDATLPLATRCRLWSVWLATAGPGPIVLDDGLRSARLARAESLVDQALALMGQR